MKGISFYYGFNSKYDERARLIKDAGFDSVLLYFEQDINDIVMCVKREGLIIDALHLPYKNEVNKIWLSEEESKSYLEKLLVGIDFAYENSIDCVVLHITSSNNPPVKNQNGISFINKLLKKCDEYNIYLCLENLRRLDYLEYIYNNCKSKYLAFCFDVGHAHAFTNNVLSFPKELLSNNMKCVHLHDNNGKSDLHILPFDGNVSWEIVCEYIQQYLRDTKISLELHDNAVLFYKDISEKEFLKVCYDRISLFYKMLGGDENEN